MKFTLVCDESGLKERYLIVGGMTLPRHNHKLLCDEFLAVKRSLGFRDEGEIKWGKVSNRYLDRYQELLSWAFQQLKSNHLRFRAHVVDTSKREWLAYGDGDEEHSFYKVYYHLLFQSMRRLALEEDGSNVLILLDHKRNRYPLRLSVLKRALNTNLYKAHGLKGIVSNVEARDSSGQNAEPFIQIVDLLIGAIGFIRNGYHKVEGASPARKKLVAFLEAQAGTTFALDTIAKAAFNIWTFDVSVAMKRKAYHAQKREAAQVPKLLVEHPIWDAP